MSESLVLYWKLNDDDANTTVADDSGNGNDGVCSVNTSTISGEGKVGLGLLPTGIQYVYRDALPELSAFEPWTFSGWFWWASETATYHLMANVLNNTSGSYDKASLRIYLDSIVRFTLYTGSGTAIRKSGYATANEWHHVAATHDGEGGIALYIDGVAQTGIYYSTTIGSAARFTVGSTSDFGNCLSGGVDDVRVYDEVLTASQIRAIRASGRGTTLAYPWRAARRRLLGRCAVCG